MTTANRGTVPLLSRAELLSIGDTVTSRWLDFRKMRSWSFGIARQDCEDLIAADAVVTFTEIPNTILATGGRHVEFGLALAQGKRVIIVGPRENVFHYLLPGSQIFATWNKAFATIRRQHTLCQQTLQRQTKPVAKSHPDGRTSSMRSVPA